MSLVNHELLIDVHILSGIMGHGDRFCNEDSKIKQVLLVTFAQCNPASIVFIWYLLRIRLSFPLTSLAWKDDTTIRVLLLQYKQCLNVLS